MCGQSGRAEGDDKALLRQIVQEVGAIVQAERRETTATILGAVVPVLVAEMRAEFSPVVAALRESSVASRPPTTPTKGHQYRR